MAIPDYQTLMLPVLTAAQNGEVRIGEIVERLANDLALTPDERGELLPSGKQTLFSNRVHWAKTYLAKAGLVEITRRAHFKITARGEEVLRSKPTRVDNRLLSKFAEFVEFTDKTNAGEDQSTQVASPVSPEQRQTPDEIMRAAHRQIDSALAQELLHHITKSSPEFFERLLVNLLLGMGYGGSRAEAGRALGRTGDDGVDGVIDQDALGLDRIYIQAKRYKLGNNVGSGAIRDFFGSLDRHKATKGLFVTTSGFHRLR